VTTIAVDVDNTLYSFEDAARQAYLDLAEEQGDESLFRGAYNPWGEWRSMMDTCGHIAGGDVIARVHSPDVISVQRPYDPAAEVLWDLVEEGYALRYISNRAPESHEATLRWLMSNHFPVGSALEPEVTSELICTFDDKIPLVRDCQYIIDDRPKTLVQFVYDRCWPYPNGRTRLGFGLAFPFNQNLTDIPGVFLAPTWSGIRYYLKKKGVLDG
jgi:FMN phosphatase YigB (HAD superfamily)